MNSIWFIFKFIFLKCFLFPLVTSIVSDSFRSSSWLVSNTFTNKSIEITATFAFTLHSTDDLKSLLNDVSDPSSKNYGKFLLAEQISSISSPSVQQLNKVKEWLVQYHIDLHRTVTNNVGDMMLVKASIEQFEVLLNTTLEWHENVDGDVKQPYVRATKDLFLPAEVDEIIEFISFNSPIIIRREAKISEDLNLSSPSKATPELFKLVMFGLETSNGGVASFSLHCWETTSSHPICLSKEPPSMIRFRVSDMESGFPDALFEVAWSKIQCLSNVPKIAPCDPFNQTQTECRCGAVIGPLPKYTMLEFSATAVMHLQNHTVQELYLGTSHSPAVLTDLMTPDLVRKLYNIPHTKVRHGSTMAVAEFDDQFYSNLDLQKYFRSVGLFEETITKEDLEGNNPDFQPAPGFEAMLDIEIMMSFAQNAEMNYYSIAESTPMSEDFLNWLFYIGLNEKPELVHSASYAYLESDFSSNVTRAFLDRIDLEFLKLGLQGSTVAIPSGDDGICEEWTPLSPVANCTHAVAGWPSSSPYVVSVGASALSNKYNPVCGTRWDEHFDLKVACTGVGEVVAQSDRGHKITSGGGFSNIYGRPWWQDKIVAQALEYPEGFPSTPGFFNVEGRGFPDVTMQGALWFVYVQGRYAAVSGTSASTPMFAAVVALLNDMLLGEGLPPLGFINPLLYYLYEKRPEIFNDVTVGSNPCRLGALGGEEPLQCSEEYFSALPGWDAVSGLGSINFEVLAEEVLKLARQKRNGNSESIMASSAQFHGGNVPTNVQSANQNTPIDKGNGFSSRLSSISIFLVFCIPTVLSLGAFVISINTRNQMKKERSPSYNTLSSIASGPPNSQINYANSSVTYGTTRL